MMDMYTVGETDLMKNADIVKVSVLRGLIAAGLVSEEEADKWAAAHTFLVHKPKWGLFSRLFGKGEALDDGLMVTLVSRAVPTEDIEPSAEPARICAWCGCGLGADPEAEKAKQANGVPITHGICADCAEKMEAV